MWSGELVFPWAAVEPALAGADLKARLVSWQSRRRPLRRRVPDITVVCFPIHLARQRIYVHIGCDILCIRKCSLSLSRYFYLWIILVGGSMKKFITRKRHWYLNSYVNHRYVIISIEKNTCLFFSGGFGSCGPRAAPCPRHTFPLGGVSLPHQSVHTTAGIQPRIKTPWHINAQCTCQMKLLWPIVVELTRLHSLERPVGSHQKRSSGGPTGSRAWIDWAQIPYSHPGSRSSLV